MNFAAAMFYQQELKRKISHYEEDVLRHKREIEQIDKRMAREDAPLLRLRQRKKALEKEIEYAEIQIKKLRKQCF